MATVETLPAKPSNRAVPGATVRPGTESPEFPGCKPVHLPRAEIERFEGRLEYWDAATETAWVCEPTSSYHERPARLLGRLTERIAEVRGSRIERYGSMDLLLRDERGEPQRIMQADESVYLHPKRAKLPGAAMVVGEDDFPDVVLEVDHTTDVRRGKLTLYESWGFPEVWGRRAGRAGAEPAADGDSSAGGRPLSGRGAEPCVSGLDGGRDPRGAERAGAVGRDQCGAGAGGRSAGARGEGTGPDDDPLLRSQRRQGFERGRAEMVRQILLSRGIKVSQGFPADEAAFAAASEAALLRLPARTRRTSSPRSLDRKRGPHAGPVPHQVRVAVR